MDELPLLESNEPIDPSESPKKIGYDLEDFIIKYRAAFAIILGAAMITLIVYLIFNMQYIKVDALKYCAEKLNASGCYCIPK